MFVHPDSSLPPQIEIPLYLPILLEMTFLFPFVFSFLLSFLLFLPPSLSSWLPIPLAFGVSSYIALLFLLQL